MDTTNGDILASASYPSYDPNNRRTYSPEKERNRVIIDSIEPASTIKPFVLAAALHSKKVNLNDKSLQDILGIAKYRSSEIEKKNLIGVTNGLAWTEVGGEILSVEVILSIGKGKLTITGKLGEVMKESIQAATSYVKSKSVSLGINPKDFENYDIHIHVPEGATPKDGPSAGGAMAISLISIFTGIPVRADTAMTGEITLRGQILKIGGLKEKLLAAKRGGIKNVIIPKENEPDLQEIPKQITSSLNIIPVEWIDEVISSALVEEPTPHSKNIKQQKSRTSRKSQNKAPH